VKLQVLYHGNCFDGVISAAIFARFFVEGIDRAAEVVFRGMVHGQGDPFGADHDSTFWAEQNAVVDFRYSPSPRLTWWCDHHHSAFIRPEHREHFEGNPNPQHRFDPKAPSCAGLLARWLADRHGLDTAPFADHIRWADLIDGAHFVDAAQAVELAAPALRLMTLLESVPPEPLLELMLRGLGRGTIDEVHDEPAIQRALTPVMDRHHETIERFRERMVVERGVAYADLTADGVGGFNKFIPYYLRDGVRYTVVLTCTPQRAKISVGSNPWQRPEPLTNIADLCARYGGGGHPVVGAVSMPPAELDRARQASLEIAEVLRGP
jgi:hypothetical protein